MRPLSTAAIPAAPLSPACLRLSADGRRAAADCLPLGQKLHLGKPARAAPNARDGALTRPDRTAFAEMEVEPRKRRLGGAVDHRR